MTGRRLRGFIAVAVAASMLSACGGPPETPEAQLRALIGDVEQAAEGHEISVFRDVVADDYQDERGFDRQTVLRIVQGVLIRNQQVHLLSLVRNIDVQGSEAGAVVLVAMAGQPIESTEALLNVRADLMRFDVDFVRRGDQWLVGAVAWRRAEVKDFL